MDENIPGNIDIPFEYFHNFDISSNQKFIYAKMTGEEFRKKIPVSRLPIPLPNKPEDMPQFSSEDKRRQYVLQPLEEVILAPELLDEVVVRCAVPDLLEGRDPKKTSYSGVILYGPPGTGKTELQRALMEVYKRAGAYASDTSLASIGTCFVQEFSKNLERVLEQGLRESEARNKQSFLSFDEGSSLVEQAKNGAFAVSKHYQESIDVLKRYIGNYRELVLAVSTNILPDTFEEALTREGRLTSFCINYPGREERMRLWQLYLKKHGVLDSLTPEQLYELADIIPKEQGAFVEELCRNYNRIARARLLGERGYSTLLEALKQGANISEDEIRASISFKQLLSDVSEQIRRKQERNGKGRKTREKIGFA